MADTHEERLLNSLLQDMRAADEGRSAPELEPRVLAAWDARRRQQAGSGRQRYPVIATAAAAVVLTYLGVSALNVADTTPLPFVAAAPRQAGAAAVAVAVPVDLPAVDRRSDSQSATGVSPIAQSPVAQSPIAQSPITQSPITQSPITQSPITQSPMEFVPLMPLTRQELSGPFQLVHIQLPRASLGAIAPPHEFPGQLVEADVLLGEDGMARAIRVSSNGSVRSWRSR
jgi:hypothetical protein